MIALSILLGISVFIMTGLTYLLGFRLGGHSWIAETQRVRREAAVAERDLHDLTRQAFVAMAEEAERRHTGS